MFASDSRTHAGFDQVSNYSKMHTFLGDGERMLTVLTAGNRATTQAVVRQLRRDVDAGASASLKSVEHLDQAAEYIGALVSMDSTMRSNVTVGPAIELLNYDSGSYGAGASR
jgi:putative proteasome-type protease